MIATLREVITYRFRSALSGGGFTSSTNQAVWLRLRDSDSEGCGALRVKAPRHDPHVGAIPTRLTAFLQNALPDASLLPLDYR